MFVFGRHFIGINYISVRRIKQNHGRKAESLNLKVLKHLSEIVIATNAVCSFSTKG